MSKIKVSAGTTGCLWGSSPWPADGRPPAASPHGCPSGHTLPGVSSPSSKDTGHVGLGPTPENLFNCTHLFKSHMS